MDPSENKLRVGQSALEALEKAGFAARFAGGCVRDRIMGIAPKDFDIATEATPEEVRSIFEQKSCRVIPTGIDHGTVTVVMKSIPMEVTTLRRDVKTDGRHAEVEFGKSFEEDAERRDFTANAMFEDRNGKIYDYFNGQSDIKNKLLRFVGDAKKRIQEDYLRILRFYRFWARLGFQADPDALEAIVTMRNGLSNISQERITAELLEMLSYENCALPLKHLVGGGVLKTILPELRNLDDTSLKEVAACVKIAQKSRAIARLAILVGISDEKLATEKFADRLRLSNGQKNTLVHLVHGCTMIASMGAETADAMELIDDWEGVGGENSFLELFAPTWQILCPSANLNKLIDCEKTAKHLRKTTMPISGKDLSETLKIPPGPALGKALAELKRAFRNQIWRTKAEGFSYLKGKK